MNTNALTTALLLTTLLLPVGAHGQTAKVGDLAWLTGCWESTSKNGTTTTAIAEQWMKPLGGSMLGMSRTVRNGKLAAYEFLRLVEDEQGINYISRPSQNKQDTAFRLTSLKPVEAVFENSAHDFPQRIIYRVKGSQLHARIEGHSNGKIRGIDFTFARVKCD